MVLLAYYNFICRYVVKTLDNAESVKLQYRSLAKVPDDRSYLLDFTNLLEVPLHMIFIEPLLNALCFYVLCVAFMLLFRII